MEEFNDSNRSEDANNVLANRLNMYKALNKDLSNRVQDLKVHLNAKAQELTVCQAALFEEKTKNAKMRQYVGLLNLHSSNFVNNYVTTVQQMADDGIEVNVAANISGVREQFGKETGLFHLRLINQNTHSHPQIICRLPIHRSSEHARVSCQFKIVFNAIKAHRAPPATPKTMSSIRSWKKPKENRVLLLQHRFRSQI
jgi:hypothetical protein